MLTYREKESLLLKDAVNNAQKFFGNKTVSDPEVKKIIKIIEQFLRRKKLICYGGTAINAILPKKDQFYDKNFELPDYDFYSTEPLNDAKELADIYYKHGYQDVEAKAGVHHGTYKVFVNFLPIADITYLDPKIFNSIKKDAIKVDGILYAPPNFLRMLMFLELSRPAGDTSRWDKVLKRLHLLNKNYTFHKQKCTAISEPNLKNKIKNKKSDYNILKKTFIDEGVIFFGGFANSLYQQYLPKSESKILNIPDFDVIAINAEKTAKKAKEVLVKEGFKNVKIIEKTAIGEIIPKHYELSIDGKIAAYIYEPIACHSYNIYKQQGKKIKIASIDTMLSFYLAFLYMGDEKIYDPNRILCMTQLLFKLQSQNRLNQKGILKRFSIKCLGEQPTLVSIRNKKNNKFKELKNKQNSKEFEEWFLKYVPYEHDKNINKKTKKNMKKNAKNKTTKKSTTVSKKKKQNKTKKKIREKKK